MSRPVSPCKECDHRAYPLCYSYCDGYIQYKKEVEAINKARQEYRMKEDAQWGMREVKRGRK